MCGVKWDKWEEYVVKFSKSGVKMYKNGES